MHIGIDVGGTYTDGVILRGGEVLRFIKTPTQQDLTSSIIEVLEQLISGIAVQGIERVVLSTTLITNLLAQGRGVSVGLILLPGPGVNPQTLKFRGTTVTVSGAVDYRGRLIENLDLTEVETAVQQLIERGIENIAVASKFAQRNTSLEEQIIKFIQENYPQVAVLASNQVNGLLNWVRRANGTVYQMMVSADYRHFIEKVETILRKMQIKCPVYILKADGGTIPLEISLQHPLEGIFSGPAASALGALAVGGEKATTVVMDIGGTTTDLALILQGVPLLSERGAQVSGHHLPVRALAVSSLAMGGDTSLQVVNGQITLGERKGRALCLGGTALTITDVLVYLGESDIVKEKDAVASEISKIAAAAGMKPQHLAQSVLDMFIEALENKLDQIYKLWEEEPAYRIWQVMSKQTKRPQILTCIGGPAGGLGRMWGKKKGWKVLVPPYASVVNAIGAALAKTTLRQDFYADTQLNTYTTNIGGVRGRLEVPLRTIDDARNYARKIFLKTGKEWGLTDLETETIYEEGFNVIRGWHTTGKIYQIGLQTPPGIVEFLRAGGVGK